MEHAQLLHHLLEMSLIECCRRTWPGREATCLRLLRSATPKNRLDGLEHDQQIEAQRLMLHVIQVVG